MPGRSATTPWLPRGRGAAATRSRAGAAPRCGPGQRPPGRRRRARFRALRPAPPRGHDGIWTLILESRLLVFEAFEDVVQGDQTPLADGHRNARHGGNPGYSSICSNDRTGAVHHLGEQLGVSAGQGILEGTGRDESHEAVGASYCCVPKGRLETPPGERHQGERAGSQSGGNDQDGDDHGPRTNPEPVESAPATHAAPAGSRRL